MEWFSADLHMGHDSILLPTYSKRKEFLRAAFGTPEITRDMHSQWIVDTLNHWVKPTDTLFLLGDISFYAGYESLMWVEKIACRHKHLVIGNHDFSRIDLYKNCGLFESVEYYKEVKISGKRYIMSHFPLLHWNAAGHGSYHLHGHTHGDLDYHKAGLQDKRILDVGWDNAFSHFNEYRPFSLNSVQEWMNRDGVTDHAHHD